MRDQAKVVADQMKAVGNVPVVAAPAPVIGGAGAQASGSDEDLKFAAGTLKWVAAECAHGWRFGQEIPEVTAAAVRGAKSVHDLGNNQNIFVECLDGADIEQFKQKPANCDPRILPVSYNAMGHPERSLKEIASICVEKPMKWQLTGPRTTRWCVVYLAVENLGFEGHHERLRQVSKADTSSWSIQEHFQVSMALRHSLLVDQVDAYNLLSVEVQFRQLQTIEFSYSEKAKEVESKAIGGRLSLEEQTTFGGITRQYSTLMICPELLDFVKIETEKEASLAKNLRKAREEREAARRGKKGKASEDP